MLKRFIDERPENDTDVLVCFMGTFDDKNFSLSDLEAYTYCESSGTITGNNHPEVEYILSRDHMDNHNWDLVIIREEVRVHPDALAYPLASYDKLENLYWIYQSDCINLIYNK